MPAVDAAISLAALVVALWLRPWRMLGFTTARTPQGPLRKMSPLVSPLLAALVLLPWFWALPTLVHMPLPLQLSGACMLVLMLGWPLAIPALWVIGLAAALLSPAMSWSDALSAIAWLGVMPATLALLLGALIRRVTGTRMFVYVLGRAFLGTVACVFISGALSQWSGHALAAQVDEGLSMVARWLMAWSDGLLTGMLTVVFVAFKPEWLATWSDRLYLPAPPTGDH
ncbi:hypothetical protein [Diaphorobacter aerolatus]|uniref:Energy-coupling factor ABC transporter permease n=1 Tax=Diaphorobacter aerolatus TaxID=1288495 RepID=A0A7H0GJ74_9BURK|nr:hypothetical protein [Diaphorobacter aerolatus]QNP48340.1 hypothetical protein H9K75_20680 [Diaphorobacter aerolatus]